MRGGNQRFRAWQQCEWVRRRRRASVRSAKADTTARSAASSAARYRSPKFPTAGIAGSAPASSSRRPIIQNVRSPRRHRPNRSADDGSCNRPAATAYADRSRSIRGRRCAAAAARCWHIPCIVCEVTNDLRATCCTMYVVSRWFPSREPRRRRYLRHSSQLSHRASGAAAKVLWTIQVSTITLLITLR